MKKSIITMAVLLCGAALVGQEVTGIINGMKNAQGEFVNKYDIMPGSLQLNKPLQKGYYCFTLETCTDYQAIIWYPAPGLVGAYEHGLSTKTMQPRIYYFKVLDSKNSTIRIGESEYSKKVKKVKFAARNLKLTALPGVPADIFPDFKKNLAAAPDGENFLYLANYSKTSEAKKVTLDKTPVLQISGLEPKEGGSQWCPPAFPMDNAGTVTIKFTAKSTGGCKNFIILLRDAFWKKGSASKKYTLTTEWKEYVWTIDCAKTFKKDIALVCADVRLGPGEYNFKDFSITYKK